MRLAFVDLMFSWPPHGGADVDLYHTAAALQAEGHTVRVIGVHTRGSHERGVFEPESLPFPAERIECGGREFSWRVLPRLIAKRVAAFGPDAVIVCDAFFLKPYVIEALGGYAVAGRYYAHEMACHRDVLRYKEGAPCPLHYLETPEACRRCALDWLAPSLRRGHHLAWTEEYLAAQAYAPGYHAVARRGLRALDAAIVYNEGMAGLLAPHAHPVFVVPGGVDTDAFSAPGPPERAADAPKVVLMTGRAEDPVKGAAVLLAAGERLAGERSDFEIRVTMPEDTSGPGWFRAVGWRDHAETAALYADADVCVVPSVWDEPFGMVALEAMASARPVCASRVGGLVGIVRHTETGFLFERGDSAELAKQLSLLLDNAELRINMGAAGRRLAERDYAWGRVVSTHFGPVIAHLEARAAAKRRVCG